MNQKMLLILAVFVGIPLLGVSPVSANTVIVGLPPDPGSGNSFPFGSAYNAEYQQVYSSSDFAGAMSITGLEFYNTQFNSGSTSLPTGTFTISLSTTSVGPSTIGGHFAGNIGGDNTQVFSGSIAQSWTFGNTLFIAFSTPFTYNPGNGNLLLDVVGSGVSTPGGSTFFDVNSTGSNTFSRVYCSGGVGCDPGTVNVNYGLVTGFEFQPVPEPGTITLAALGILGTFFLLRMWVRRRGQI
jgi:hypothetical protein